MNQHVHPTQDVPFYHFYFVCSFLIVSAFVHFVSICLFVGLKLYPNRIDGVMDSVLASSAVGCGFESRRIKPKTMELVCAASAQSMQL